MRMTPACRRTTALPLVIIVLLAGCATDPGLGSSSRSDLLKSYVDCRMEQFYAVSPGDLDASIAACEAAGLAYAEKSATDNRVNRRFTYSHGRDYLYPILVDRVTAMLK